MSEALEQIKLRNDFYRDNFRRLVWVMIVSFIANLVLIGILFFMSTREPAPIYFATTQDGKLLSLSSSSQPIVDDQAILAWVSRNVPELYSVNYVEYRKDVQNMQQYFTPAGWGQFSQTFNKVVKEVIDNKLIMSATLYDVPVILKSGTFGNTQSWQIQVPLLVSYQKDDKVQTQRIILQIIVQRADNTKSDQLLGISQVLEKVLDNNP